MRSGKGVKAFYTKKDYEGEFNLKMSERQLILMADRRFPGNLHRMANALYISINALKFKIIQHGLEL
jgi:DNA-binding NtrC family response regulator